MKNKHAQALGKLGGKARSKALTKDQKSAIGKKAVLSRWEKHKKDKGIVIKIALFLLFSLASWSFAESYTQHIGDRDYKHNDDGSVEMGYWIGNQYHTETLVDAPKQPAYQPSTGSNMLQNYYAVQNNREIEQLRSEVAQLRADLYQMALWAKEVNKRLLTK